MKLFIEDPIEIKYLLEILDYDKSYIRLRMDEHMKHNTKDFDEFVEIDDMLHCNEALTYRLEQLAERKGLEL